MTTQATLETLYPHRTINPSSVKNIPRKKYMVYMLTYDDKPIIVGHGKYNRAKVIFDDRNHITPNHIKAFFVRAYRLYGSKPFEQFIIECADKTEAMNIEKRLHEIIHGNSRKLPKDILAALFENIKRDSLADTILRIAIGSSFDGLSDLCRWRREGILNDDVWMIVQNRLQLKDPKK